MTTLWVARLETRNFDFEAYDVSPQGAERSMRGGILKHCRQYDLNFADFMFNFWDDVQVYQRELGCAYRDRTPL